MDLILFSCRTRLNSYFRQKQLQRFLLLGLGVIMSGVYSWLFSFLLQQAHEGGINPSVEKVLSYANLLLLAFIILRGFFPAYVPKTEFVHRLYPIKPLKKFWVELVVELASPFYFVLLNFLIMLFLLSPDYNLIHFIQSVLVLLTAHITKRSLQLIIERKIKWLGANFYSAAVMAAAFVAIQAKQPMFEPITTLPLLVVHLLAMGFFLTSNYFLEQAAYEPKLRVVNYSQDARRSLGWRLFKNHGSAKQMALFGIGFKALILGIDAVAYTVKVIHIFDKNVSMWLFVGPLVIYTYVFNNIWGYYKNLWLTTERASGYTKDFFQAALMPLRVPLMIDIALVVLYVAIFNQDQAVFILLMYTASVLILMPLGIIASFISPKVVRGGAMSFGAKTSYLFTFISIFVVGLLCLPMLHPLLYTIYPVLIALSFFTMAAVLKEYPKNKYKLFETLFKTEA